MLALIKAMASAGSTPELSVPCLLSSSLSPSSCPSGQPCRPTSTSARKQAFPLQCFPTPMSLRGDE